MIFHDVGHHCTACWKPTPFFIKLRIVGIYFNSKNNYTFVVKPLCKLSALIHDFPGWSHTSGCLPVFWLQTKHCQQVSLQQSPREQANESIVPPKMSPCDKKHNVFIYLHFPFFFQYETLFSPTSETSTYIHPLLCVQLHFVFYSCCHSSRRLHRRTERTRRRSLGSRRPRTHIYF